MLDNDTPMLELASRILSPKTIKRIRASSMTQMEWKILDRWALTEPENLKALETKQGTMAVLDRAWNQMNMENEALDSEQGMRMLENGLSRQETLELLGVDTRLGIA